jgi:transcriptional regulator with XRE-family HTH domain
MPLIIENYYFKYPQLFSTFVQNHLKTASIVLYMNIGDKITALRKEKNLSQTDLGKAAGVSREIIGRYERNEVLPSIEVAAKIADVLDISLDYMAGNSKKVAVDKKTMKLIHDIEDLEPTIKDKLIFLANAVIRDAKTGKAYA